MLRISAPASTAAAQTSARNAYAPAEDVYVWLAERLPDGAFSGPIAPQHRLGALTPDDGWVEWRFAEPWASRTPSAGAVLADWNDGEAEYRDREIGGMTILR